MAEDSPNIAKSYIWNVEIMFLQIVDMVKQTLEYKNKMKVFALEHNQAMTNKKKGSKNKIWLVLFEFHRKKKMPLKEMVLMMHSLQAVVSRSRVKVLIMLSVFVRVGKVVIELMFWNFIGMFFNVFLGYLELATENDAI